MNPAVQALRNALATACRVQGVRFGDVLEDFGVEEVLEEADAGNWPARELSCQVLTRCCVTDGTFNNFQAGFLAVANFIDSACRPLGKHREQALKDLLSTLQTAGTEQAIRQWIDTNYP
jgi:hypothetical protein